MANYRGGRINEEVKREISAIIRNEIKDPRLTAMVSVTDVKVTKDLRYAKVFVSIFGKDDEEKRRIFILILPSKQVRFTIIAVISSRSLSINASQKS